VGGTLGVSLGTIAAIGVAFAQNWSVTLDPVVLLDGFVIAIPISMVGGIVPAIRAVRTDPVNALRSA
jgi:putative ABC transport system permease protein